MPMITTPPDLTRTRATLASYDVIDAEITADMARVSALPGVRAWIDGALAEHDFLDFEEPYRLKA